MGLRGFDGQGCILADDMGLGKTLMSITALWTLLNQGFVKGESAVRKVMVVCPTSLVGNWDNEIRKWVGDKCPTFAVKGEPKKMIKTFIQHRGKGVLIISYETQRLYAKMFENALKNAHLLHNNSSTTTSYNPCCDLIICDEAHKLKNAESGLSKTLNVLPAKKRILLSGTPMQNELTEFYNMVNFCNPNVIGTVSEFRKRYERPILASREPDALESEIAEAGRLQKELSVIVNEFILKRGNILNAQHLPPKLVQFVCCRLTPLQEAMYERLLSSKEIRHIREGKQTNTLNSIRQLINICSHPRLVLDTYHRKLAANEPIDDDLAAMVELIPKTSKPVAVMEQSTTKKPYNPMSRLEQLKNKPGLHGSNGLDSYIDPEQSGKMAVLFRMMQAMRVVNKQERIVIVSNYTSTLDLIETMCKQNIWPVLRLDGTISGNKRTKLVEEFNNPQSNAFAFLLSSKAGGCGINLIGGNRLVLFDPDWNPASDKQAAGRIWREGQKRRCFIYRFMSTGSIEEKIIQRQLSKEGLADIVDDKEQINQFSSDELKQLFTLRKDSRSETHDTLRCVRCKFMKNKTFQSKKDLKFSQEQINSCLLFLDSFEQYLLQESLAYQKRELVRNGHNDSNNDSNTLIQELPCREQLNQLRQQLDTKSFDNLTQYSRKQRETFQRIEELLNEGRAIAKEEQTKPQQPVPNATTVTSMTGEDGENPQPNIGGLTSEEEALKVYNKLFPLNYSIYNDFLKQWTDLVPSLVSLATVNSANTAKTVDKDGDEESTEEFVEQEGCPEDTDFNRWSHHCSPLTCDDELFSKALGDDEALVSFVFGLEVNFSLLEAREALMRDEVERRKEQQRKDLEELNERRRLQKLKKERGDVDDDDESGSDSEGDNEEKEKESVAKSGKGKKGKKGEGKAKSEKGSKKRKAVVEPALADGESEHSAVEEDSDHHDASGGDDSGSAEELDHDDETNYFREERSKSPPPITEKKPTKKTKDSPMEKVQDESLPESASKKKSKKQRIEEETNIEPTVVKAKGKDKVKEIVKEQSSMKEKVKEKSNLPPIPPTSVPPSSSRTKRSRSEGVPLSMTLDPQFQPDWIKLKKVVEKGKMKLINFDIFFHVLKSVNNSWRSLFIDPNDISSEIFTRVPGLKGEKIASYEEGVDYFRGVEEFLRYVVNQGMLLGDAELASVIEGFMTESVSSSSSEDDKKPKSPQKQQKTSVIDVSSDKENVENLSLPPQPTTKRAKKSSLDSSDEDESTPLPPRRQQGMDSLLSTVASHPDVAKVIPADMKSKSSASKSGNNGAEDEAKHVSFTKPILSQDSSAPSDKADGFWACPMCTFQNDSIERVSCRMCG